MARSKFEIRAHKELEEKGWIVDYKIRPSGFKNPSNYSVDYFELFDLLAQKPGIVRWIAIKGQGGVPSTLREAIEEINLGEGSQKEIWTYRKLASDKRSFDCKKEMYTGKTWELLHE